VFIDSGAMYRAVTLFIIRHNIPLELIKKDPELLKSIEIKFKYNPENDFFETYLNGVIVEKEIRNMEVANYVSEVSAVKQVREFLVHQQKQFANDKGVVMDGRDIGTKVMPDAELKIFMTADPVIRARRRFEELEGKEVLISYEEVLANIKKRDMIDSTREESPLVKAEDAIILDNTNMSIEEQARVALTWAKGVIAVS